MDESFVELKTVGLEKKIDSLRAETIEIVINRVNQINGGPVSEGKCLEMLKNERNTNIKQDIGALENLLRKFMKEEVFSRLDSQERFLESTSKFCQEIDSQVQQHDTYINDDEKDLVDDPEEDKKNGIINQFGMRFTKDGEMIRMTRPQLQRHIMNSNQSFHNINDELTGIHDTLHSQNERIKAFNKKLANGKADT